MSQSQQALATPKAQAMELKQYLDSPRVTELLVKAAPAGLTPERLIRQVLTLANKTPGLLVCTPRSILAGMIQAAELGLELSGPLGQAFLVPRRIKGTDEATFQVGYRGYVNLGYRSGKVADWQVRTVYENDLFDVQYGTANKLVHKPNFRDKGELLGFYSLVHLTTGGSDFEFMTVEEAKAHRARYAARNPIWDSNFIEMAQKTCTRDLAKRVPVSVQLTSAALADSEGEKSPAEIGVASERTDALAALLDGPSEIPPEEPAA